MAQTSLGGDIQVSTRALPYSFFKKKLLLGHVVMSLMVLMMNLFHVLASLQFFLVA